MATHTLFQDAKVWATDHLPAPFNMIGTSGSTLKNRFSMNDVSAHTYLQLFTALTPSSKQITMNGMLVWALLYMCPEYGLQKLHKFSVEEISHTDELLWYAAEYDVPNGDVLVVDYQVNRSRAPITTKLRGARVSAGTHSFSALGAPATTGSGLKARTTFPYPMELVYLPVIYAMREHNAFFDEETEEMLKLVREIHRNPGHTFTNEDLLRLAQYSHLFYGLVEQEQFKNSAIQRLPVKFVAGNINILPSREIEAGPYADGEMLLGNAEFLRGSVSSVTAQATQKPTVANLKKEYAAFNSQFHWTEEERLFIPQFKDDMIVPEETIEFAKAYVGTRDMAVPMVNFLWRGKTSYGKSTGVELLACILDRPLLRQTCHPGMETQDFLSAYVPDTGPSYIGEIPTVEEMYGDPETAYERITGVSKEDATSQECLEELLKRSARSSGAARFKHVEANYVKALKNGYIVELSEVSRIREPGVLVGLDDYDKPGAIVPLVNGSYVQRHRDAIVVMTDNVGYASCRPVDAAVLRRNAFVLDTDTMPKAKVIERVKKNTGFDDKSLMDIMYTTWKELSDYCETHEINEGPISLTELERWVQKVKIDGGNVYDNCVKCVVSKVTSNREEQKELMRAVLDLRLQQVM